MVSLLTSTQTRILQILGDLGLGKRLTQRRSDVNDRRAITDIRKFLKSYVMPLAEDPLHEFEDGWGIKFTVNDRIGRRQVTMMEEEEIADSLNENSPCTYQDDIDPEEMAGCSIRRT
jgi:predicted Ser/Thr protein kinase